MKRQNKKKYPNKPISPTLNPEDNTYSRESISYNYVETLNKVFQIRRTENPFYSLRQYARDLELSPMHLSYILRGQRGLSRLKADVVVRSIGKDLKLSYQERIKFVRVVTAISARSLAARNMARLALANIETKIIKLK